MVNDWHKPGITSEQILEALREGREENDKKFDSYVEYATYMVKKNKEILDKLGSDYDENGVPYWDKWTSKQIGDDFEMSVLKDLEQRGFNLISRNVHMKGTGCEVDFLARNDSKTWHVEAKGGKPGTGKRPGAKRTDNVKKAVANAALIKAVYKDVYFVVYFSSRPKLKTYSREMIDTARAANLFDEVIYLEV